MLHEKHKTRLEEEYEQWKGLSVDELLKIKLECHEARSIIAYDMGEARYNDSIESPWYRKAMAAYRIYGIKLAAIESLISLKRENYKFYKDFLFYSKKLLETDQFDRIFNLAAEGKANNKVLSELRE